MSVLCCFVLWGCSVLYCVALCCAVGRGEELRFKIQEIQEFINRFLGHMPLQAFT